MSLTQSQIETRMAFVTALTLYLLIGVTLLAWGSNRLHDKFLSHRHVGDSVVVPSGAAVRFP